MDNEKVLAQVIKNLSDRWDMTVSEVAEKLNKMSEDEIKNVVEMTKLFEKGGKLNYLLCLKKGGVADCGCGKKLKVQEGGKTLPSMKYEEAKVNIPYRTAGRDTELTIGTIRSDGNGASVFESNFERYPTQVLSRPNDLAYDESVKDRIDRRQSFQNKMRNANVVTTPDSGLAEYNKGGITPESKPKGIKGWFWKPTKYPRVDFYDNLDGDFTGTRSWYIDQNGNEYQTLEKTFPAGNTATTELKITPKKDSTMVITNSRGTNRVRDMRKFLPAFKKNF